MTTDNTTSTALADLCICAAAEAWRGDGEILASGIGVIPRLAASLAMLTHSPDLLMTDGEAYLVSEPVPIGPRRDDHRLCVEGWMPYVRVFDTLWNGRRHAMVGPSQIDCFGQANISCIGEDYRHPKAMLLGVRGLPGNSINHANSMFVPKHTRQVFVEGEVDMVCSAGYNTQRWGGKVPDWLDIRLIVSNLCVLDFATQEQAMRVRSLHPGVSAEEVADNTGFPLLGLDEAAQTPEPDERQLELIARLDPSGLRARVLPTELKNS